MCGGLVGSQETRIQLGGFNGGGGLATKAPPQQHLDGPLDFSQPGDRSKHELSLGQTHGGNARRHTHTHSIFLINATTAPLHVATIIHEDYI